MTARLVAMLLLVALLAPRAAPAEDRLWTFDAHAPIRDYRMGPFGHLLVLSTSAVIAVDPETGRAIWQREFPMMDPELATDDLLPCAILHTTKTLEAIDLETGESWWGRSAIPLQKIYGYLTVPEIGAVMVFGKSGGSDRSVVLIDLATGATRWRQDALLAEKPQTQRWEATREIYGDWGVLTTMSRHQRPIVHDGGIVFFVGKDGLVKVDAGTGNLIWKVYDLSGEDAPMLSLGYAPFVVQDDVVYVPYDRKMMAVNLVDGSVVWRRDKNFKGHIRQMEMSAEGLVVLGFKGGLRKIDNNREVVFEQPRDFCMEVLVPGSGYSRWGKPLTDLDAALPFFVDEDYAFVPRSQDVLLVDLQQGDTSQFVRLELKGGEIPTHVERVGNDYLVASPQNMVLLKSRGGRRYHVHYPAAGRSAFEKVLAIAGGLVLDEVFDTSLDAPNLVEHGPHSIIWAARPFSTASIEMCFERFRLTTEGRKHRFIYTDQPSGGRKGYSLVKVEKATGKETKRIWVDKSVPDYRIDFATDTVFALDGTLHNKVFAVR